jgi:hypothetical protein
MMPYLVPRKPFAPLVLKIWESTKEGWDNSNPGQFSPAKN